MFITAQSDNRASAEEDFEPLERSYLQNKLAFFEWLANAPEVKACLAGRQGLRRKGRDEIPKLVS